MKPKNLFVVLVEPLHQGNIGAAARAMKNCGLSDLRIVRGVKIGKEAQRLATHALDVLKKAKRFPSLEEAVADASRVVGFTAKSRKFGPPQFSLPELAPTVRDASDSSKIALVFGRENHGLFNEEIKLCTELCRIPGNSKWPVYNLAQAVLLASYSIVQFDVEAGSHAGLKFGRAQRPAPTEAKLSQLKKKKLMEEFEALILGLGYEKPLQHNRSARILARLAQQFDRALIQEDDLQLWRGLLSRLRQRF